MRYIEKTTDSFEKLKFQLPQNSPFQAKTYAADSASNIELSTLTLAFKVDYGL